MTLVGVMVLWSVRVATSSAQPTTAPLLEPLAGGALRYDPPTAPWQLISRGDLGARYQLPEEKGFLEIAVTTINGELKPGFAQQYALKLGKAIRDEHKQQKAQLLYGPRVEADDRFWLKVHDKFRASTGKAYDRVQCYRTFGVYIARVTGTGVAPKNDATTQPASVVLAVAEDLLDRMKTQRGVHPTVFPHTAIRITPPVDWKETKLDQPNGVVATYEDLREPLNQIIVRARIIPRAARADEAKRNALLDRMIDEERQTTPFSSKNRAPPDQREADEKALAKVTASATLDGQKFAVQTRYQVVNDVLVSVRAIAPEANADAVNRIAEAMARGITPNK
jgi:hypothetical protein